MRINRFVANALQISRRAADALITAKEVQYNGRTALPADQVSESDVVSRAGIQLTHATNEPIVIMLHKPVGYICSHKQQGSTPTIFSLLPPEYRTLNPVGRLDKDSSGILLLTNDGEMLYELTHPKFIKDKVYEVTLLQPLSAEAQKKVQQGVNLEDGISALQLQMLTNDRHWRVTMHEGRNRQIRRTFKAVDREVVGLHRIQFGDFTLGELPEKSIRKIS